MSELLDSNEILALLAKASGAAKIKSLLSLHEISQTDLAIKCGVHTSDLSRVINGLRRTPRIRKAIADELGVSVEALFGALDREQAQRKTQPEADGADGADEVETSLSVMPKV